MSEQDLPIVWTPKVRQELTLGSFKLQFVWAGNPVITFNSLDRLQLSFVISSSTSYAWQFLVISLAEGTFVQTLFIKGPVLPLIAPPAL